MTNQERASIDFLILADWAQVVGGKLYLQGGCWDSLTVRGEFPHTRSIGVAVGFRVPPDAENRKHDIEIRLDEEAKPEPLTRVSGELEIAPDRHGSEQIACVAFNGIITVQGPTVLTLRVLVDAAESKALRFRVLDGAPA